jgi:hypothetical protein
MKNNIGDKFKDIEIIETAEKYGWYIQWKCKCKCGNILIIQNRHLKNIINCGNCNKVRINKSTFTGITIKKKTLKNG